jgi:hypothetical protein
MTTDEVVQTIPRVLDRRKVMLWETLSDHELALKGQELAAVLEDAADEIDAQDSAKSAMKARLKELDTKLVDLRRIVSRGKAEVEVECEEIANYDTGKWQLVRTDTREIVQERLLTEDEQQLEFPITPPEATGVDGLEGFDVPAAEG